MLITVLLVLAAVVIVLLATLRLTRFVTTDWLGEWLFVGRAKNWSTKPESEILTKLITDPDLSKPDLEQLQLRLEAGDRFSWQGRLVKGLTCPFCVGYWIGLGLLAVSALTLLAPVSLVWIWWIMLGALALNYVVGHVSSRLD